MNFASALRVHDEEQPTWQDSNVGKTLNASGEGPEERR